MRSETAALATAITLAQMCSSKSLHGFIELLLNRQSPVYNAWTVVFMKSIPFGENNGILFDTKSTDGSFKVFIFSFFIYYKLFDY